MRIAPLLALGTAVFITSLTETLPAGVLPEMSVTLGVSPGAAGQAVTVYAAGTALTAVPLAAATAAVPRKPLLLAAMVAFLVANTATACAPGYAVLLGARFLAGVAARLAWAILAGYARRIAPPGKEGRAIAVAMAGIPLALSLGVPVGTLIGQQVGWRTAFAAVSVVTVAVLAWIVTTVPPVGESADHPAAAQSPVAQSPVDPASVDPAAGVRSVGGGKAGVREVMAVPGVSAVMVTVVTFVLGHTVLYAYIAPYLRHAGLAPHTDTVLLAFGVACLAGIACVGRLVDHHLRTLTITAATLFTAATLTFAAILTFAPPVAFAATIVHPVVWIAAVVWGLGWGGVPTLLQTAAGQAGLRRSTATADTAQAVLVTLWNAAMAAGGLLGGLLLQAEGPAAVAATAAALGAVSLVVVATARHHAFPPAHSARKHHPARASDR